jgi:hypothetical protein
MIGVAMAGANLPAKKYKKTSPTVTRLSFEFDGGSTQFIDIAAALSAINRRFYRQGVYYYVNSVEIYNNETGVVDLHTVPDTWVTKNAWNRGFALWQKMNAMVNSPLSNVRRPRYHDFKVYMSDLHRQTGTTSPKLHGINALISTSATSPDDWDYSQFVSADDDQDAAADADEFYVHMIGPNAGSSNNWQSVGLIHSYARSRLVITQPEIDVATSIGSDSHAQDDPLLNVFDFSSEEQMNDIIDNLDSDNDLPPYDVDTYIGMGTSHMQHVARIGTEVGVGRVGRASGFCAPFGLICVDPHGVSTAFRVVLNLAVGTYHGVYAERA